LKAPEFTRRLLAASHAFHQPSMDLPHEPKAHGQSRQLVESPLKRANVVDDFPSVVFSNGGLRTGLKKEELGQTRFRPFDTRAKNSLPAEIRAYEKVGIRQMPAGPVELPQCSIGFGELVDHRGVQHQPARDWRGHERNDGVPKSPEVLTLRLTKVLDPHERVIIG
jgi:hypothetical protein